MISDTAAVILVTVIVLGVGALYGVLLWRGWRDQEINARRLIRRLFGFSPVPVKCSEAPLFYWLFMAAYAGVVLLSIWVAVSVLRALLQT